MNPAILIVDDEQAFVDSVVRMLRIEGYDDVQTSTDPTVVESLLENNSFDIAFLDITMPGLDGLDLLKIIKEKSPQTECIMITANESVPMVVKAIRRGAYDYLLKPIIPDQLVMALDRALEHRRMFEALVLKSNRRTVKALNHPEAFEEIVTSDSGMLGLMHEAELHAASSIPILITGETGVGKELLAQSIHRASRRAKEPFVAVNMLALSSTLFESEFFGHAKGAFTGADRDKAGFLGKAQNGSLFLDEIGDLSMEIQGKLLRILQEGEYVPVGKTLAQKADIRFMAATNRNLQKLVDEGKFRKDLYYRLQFAHLQIPPLKDRPSDIPLLSGHFVREAEGKGKEFSESAHATLLAYDWPGNVRELKGIISAASNLAEEGLITPKQLKLSIRNEPEKAIKGNIEEDSIQTLAEVEKRHILAVYKATEQNKSKASRILGIGLQTLHRKLKAYNVK